MMKNFLVSWATKALLIAVPLLVWTSADAHHSTIAFYDKTRWMVLEGTVVEVFFINPHVSLHLEVTDEAGNSQIWAVETGHRAGLQNELEDQWFKTTLQPGDPLVAIGNPGKRVETSMSAGGLMRPSDGWRWRWYQVLKDAPEELQSKYVAE